MSDCWYLVKDLKRQYGIGKMQFDKFCESSLAVCFGKYVFLLCDPAVVYSDYSEAQRDCKLKILDDI